MTNDNPSPSAKPTAPTQKTNISDELLKLGELKEKGILTEEEFAAAKAALLRSLHAATPPEQSNAPRPDVTICPKCKVETRIPESSMGREIKCPSCRVKFTAAPGLGSLIKCDKCFGDGKCDKCLGDKRCKKCNGKGEVRSTKIFSSYKDKETCPKCGGDGDCPKCGGDGDCPKCDGTGWEK